MSLDVNVMQQLDKWAELVSDKGDHEALNLINNINPGKTEPYLRSQYVKYYFQAKRDNKTLKEEKGYGHGV